MISFPKSYPDKCIESFAGANKCGVMTGTEISLCLRSQLEQCFSVKPTHTCMNRIHPIIMKSW